MADTIRHQGIVESITGSFIRVKIVQTSACATCSIKGHCTSADTKEKVIDVTSSESASYEVGQRVWVIGALSTGVWAVVLAFVIPLVLLVITLFIAMALVADELLAVAVSLLCVAVYYGILRINRSWMGRKFSFSILPMS